MNLFEPTTPSPTTTIQGACVIESCSKPTYDGLCSPCMILFGPYASLVEMPGTDEWDPEAEPAPAESGELVEADQP